MSSNNYWKGLDELDQTEEFVSSNANEFSDGLPLEQVFSNEDSTRANRRDFLKYFGFGLGAVTLAACNKTPIKKAIPYVEKPDHVTPGVPLYYASSSISDYVGHPILVKVREGRPIKFEPNSDAKFFGCGLDGLAHSAILSLYDTTRIKGPIKQGKRKPIKWSEADKYIIDNLDKVAAKNKSIAIVTRNNTSLLLNQSITKFKAKYPNTSVIPYEAITSSGILRANEKSFGKAVIPTYHFDKAKLIVSFGADFLGTWLNAGKARSDYAQNRKPDGDMSRHYQFESLMTLSGANSDVRLPMRSNQTGLHLLKLYNILTKGSDSEGLELPGNHINKIAKELKDNRGKSVVLCGSNNIHDQIITNAINLELGNYGDIIDLENHYNGNSIDEKVFLEFVEDAKQEKYGAVIFVDSNPQYSFADFDNILNKIEFKVSNSIIDDETSRMCDIIAPNTHPLESWDIKQPYKGKYVFSQPTISPVFDGRNTSTSFAKWADENIDTKNKFSYDYEALKTLVSNEIGRDFNKLIEKGFFEKEALNASTPSFLANVNDSINNVKSRKKTSKELVLYQKLGVKDGSFANNPWAHEMPDPVTKVTWDNYLTVSKPDADELKLVDNNVALIEVKGQQIELPVIVQPGQVKGSFGIALGYGRKYAESVKNDMQNLGTNVYPLVGYANNTNSYVIDDEIKIISTGREYELARTQTHNSIEGRDIVREASLEEYRKDPKLRKVNKHHNLVTLWQEYDYSKGHHWAKVIDLNTCNGCSACVVSCSIENNVPIVGRDEVRRRREMHWLRIDRYYSFEALEDKDLKMSIVHGGDRSIKKGDQLSKEKVMETYSEEVGNFDYYQYVSTVHQPMMCQHCDNAPCETVCPVLATTHSSEGLNQMTYNRCIGTKYCGNNCPYKVRRFNWFRYNENEKFDYHFSNDLGKMVINPDVTVRSRGVMEKCSMCVQKIQAAKLVAKREGRKLKTDEFTVACAQTCSSDSIVFGDLNDPNSMVSKLYKKYRAYHVIEELGTKPSIKYLTKIRNKKQTTNHS